MAMEEEKKSNPKKWDAKVSTTLPKATPDQIFPLFKDFFNLHKWFPGLPTCYGIHGDNGELGCIRYCAGSGMPSVDDDDQEEVKISWSKERLIAVDPIGKSLSYDIVDCNIGFKSYVSTVQISPGGDGGCVIDWSISLDPVEGWSFEDLVMRFKVKLNGMAMKMEDALFSS